MTRKFSTEVEIHWADVDPAGVVYFPHFFRFFSIAEAAFYRSFGPTMLELENALGIHLPRVDAHCRYIKPVRFGEILQIEFSVAHVGSKTIKYQFDVKRTQELVAQGHLVVVSVTQSDFKSTPLPERLREMLAPYSAAKALRKQFLKRSDSNFHANKLLASNISFTSYFRNLPTLLLVNHNLQINTHYNNKILHRQWYYNAS